MIESVVVSLIGGAIAYVFLTQREKLKTLSVKARDWCVAKYQVIRAKVKDFKRPSLVQIVKNNRGPVVQVGGEYRPKKPVVLNPDTFEPVEDLYSVNEFLHDLAETRRISRVPAKKCKCGRRLPANSVYCSFCGSNTPFGGERIIR